MLQDIKGLNSTGQMPVLVGGEGQAERVSALGGFHTCFLPSLGCTEGGVVAQCQSLVCSQGVYECPLLA